MCVCVCAHVIMFSCTMWVPGIGLRLLDLATVALACWASHHLLFHIYLMLYESNSCFFYKIYTKVFKQLKKFKSIIVTHQLSAKLRFLGRLHFIRLRKKSSLGAMAHACNPQEPEAGGFLFSTKRDLDSKRVRKIK